MSFEAMTWAVAQPLPALQKLVLLMLANRTNADTGMCHPSLDRMATDCGMSKSAVKDSIRRLRAAGVIEVIHRRDVPVALSNAYRLDMRGGGAPRALPPGASRPAGGAPADPGVGRHTPPNQEDEPLKKKEESAHTSSHSKVVFNAETRSIEGLTPELRQRLQEVNPEADVDRELRRAAAWLADKPPEPGKDILRLLLTFMDRAQPRSVTGAAGDPQQRRRTVHDERADWTASVTGRPRHRGSVHEQREEWFAEVTGRPRPGSAASAIVVNGVEVFGSHTETPAFASPMTAMSYFDGLDDDKPL